MTRPRPVPAAAVPGAGTGAAPSDEIRFVNDSAAAWDISPWVGIDPLVCFGAPTVRGTRIPVRTILANLADATEQEVADWYELSVCQVRGVAEFAI